MNDKSRLIEHRQMGLIKASKGIITYTDESLSLIINSSESLIGKKIETVLPGYGAPEETEKPTFTILSIESSDLLIVSISMPSPDQSCLLLYVPLDKLEFFKKIDFSEKIFRFSFLESLLRDVVITDSNGVITHASETFEEFWGIKPEKIIGRTVYEMEKKKIFYPLITPIVLKSKTKATIIQHNKKGEKYLITATPIFDENNEVEYIVSYFQDIKEFTDLEEQYRKLQLQVKRYSSELQELRQKDMRFLDVMAKSEEMNNVLNLALKVSPTDINIIITGETGVGKTLIARMIHKHSDREKGPFIEINCGAIPETLLESELFGYEAGAFTGASKTGKVGVIEMANKGTLFLDEIGDLPIGLQVKLLKVIQEKKIIKLGGKQPIDVDFRLVSATNQNIEEMVEKGTFRKDLYYRLNVVPIKIPPLRNRTEDILEFITYFMSLMNRDYMKKVLLSNSAINRLLSYEWPGNVRELKNVIERIVITSNNSVVDKSLIDNILGAKPFGPKGFSSLAEAKEKVEEEMVKLAYSKYGTSISVAKHLGISQTSASRKIRKYINV
ncbi:MAG: sigma 54-interacting transcriptional regulator [Desulfobacterales bacterium]|nr:sigma 54-interacting transcriptional regulator [Desulfobacterales bacterium]